MTSKAKAGPKALGNRAFGLIFAAIFLLIAIVPALWAGEFREWAGITAFVFAGIAIIAPKLLTPLNRLWAKFGLLMHKITNPIFMGLVFYLTVLPTGLIIRLLGKDPLRRRIDTAADSYWLPREQVSPTPDSFDNQF